MVKRNASIKKKRDAMITKNMSFSEIIQKKPEAMEVLFRSGMHCIGCSMAAFETLEEGALMHGLDPDKLVLKINGKKESKKLRSKLNLKAKMKAKQND